MHPIPTQARIEYLKVENFRALRAIEFKNLTPLTVLLGPNGSGDSIMRGFLDTANTDENYE